MSWEIMFGTVANRSAATVTIDRHGGGRFTGPTNNPNVVTGTAVRFEGQSGAARNIVPLTAGAHHALVSLRALAAASPEQADAEIRKILAAVGNPSPTIDKRAITQAL